MSDKELEHLVGMLNDIVLNFSFQPDTADLAANHLTRFWAPSMREKIMAHLEAGGDGLSEPAKQALARLQS